MWKMRSSGRSSLLLQTTHPTPYLCPLTLMLFTSGSRKSHSSSGDRNGAMNPPLAASTWMGVSHPVRRFWAEQVVEALHVFELAGERGPQDCRSVQTFFLLWFCNRFPFRGVAVHARAYALIYCLRRRGRGKPERRYYLCFACPMT
jgi:hypothetical protein